MKSLDFIFIGGAKEPSCQKLEEGYFKRIKRYQNASLICLKDSSDKNISVKKKKESESLIKAIKPNDFVVICDETGQKFSTEQFTKKITEWQVAAQRIVFIVGGAFGMTEELLKKGKSVIRLSDFTLPHELARVVLLEQVYRVLTILKGEKYHHR